MSNISIVVKEADICAGIPGEGNFCPISVAAQRAFPDARHICTNLFHLYVIDFSYKKTVYLLPSCAVRFVLSFDAGLSVKPITFEIEEIRPCHMYAATSL